MLLHLGEKCLSDRIARFRANHRINAAMGTNCRVANSVKFICPTLNLLRQKDGTTVKTAALLTGKNFLPMVNRVAMSADSVRRRHGWCL